MAKQHNGTNNGASSEPRVNGQPSEEKQPSDANPAVAALLTLLGTVLAPPTMVDSMKAFASFKAGEADRTAAARIQAAKGYMIAAIINNVVFLLALGGCLAFLFFVIKELKPDKDLLLPVLSSIISLIAGAGGGFVFGRHSVPQNTK